MGSRLGRVVGSGMAPVGPRVGAVRLGQMGEETGSWLGWRWWPAGPGEEGRVFHL